MTRRTLTLSVAVALMLVFAREDVEAQRQQRDRVTRTDIETSPHKALNLLEFLRNVRPQFLERPRGATATPIAVYVDGRKRTGAEVLRDVRTTDVDDVVYFEPGRAQSEFGPAAASGAIVVKLRRGVDLKTP